FSVGKVDYNKPAGFDRARNREVGKKDITLETMEEAFTSEHWIVRIFKARGEEHTAATRRTFFIRS
ncbi:unnamed protein product, partial [Scytosiphon promiscuus]